MTQEINKGPAHLPTLLSKLAPELDIRLAHIVTTIQKDGTIGVITLNDFAVTNLMMYISLKIGVHSHL